MEENKIALVSALIYTGLSVAASLLFIIFTLSKGGFTSVETYGGGVWIFILAMIILMPLVIPYVKKKYQK